MEALPLTKRDMELSIDRAVDDAGLEAGVRVAEGHRGGHSGSELNDDSRR